MLSRYVARSFENLEQIVRSVLNLRYTKGSGNVHNDGDGRGTPIDGDTSMALLAECKYTSKIKGSVSFKKSDFNKIQKSSMVYGRTPILCISDGDGQIYVMTTLEDFKRIYNDR